MKNFILFFFVPLFSFGSQNVILTEKNYEDIYLKQSSFEKQKELSQAKSELALAQLNLKYGLTATLDYSKQKDQTESTSTFLQQDSDLNKFTSTLSKKWITGTSLSLEYNDNHPTNKTQPATTTTDYYSKAWTLTAEQDLLNSIFGQSDWLQYKAVKFTDQLEKIKSEQELNQIKQQFADLFWSTLYLQKSIEENDKLLKQYEKLVQRVSNRNQFNYSNAGEYEQALAEYETKIQTLANDKISYQQKLVQIKEALLLSAEDTLALQFENSNLLPLNFNINSPVEDTLIYKINQLENEALLADYESLKTSTWPTLSLYAKYTQAGVDADSSEAQKKMFKDEYNKTVVGLKLDYTFDQDSKKTAELIKLKTYQIKSQKMAFNKDQIQRERQLLSEKNKTLLQQIESQKKVVSLRQKATLQIQKNFTQGRIDISNLIDAYNRQLNSELQYIKNYGEYSMLKYQFFDYESSQN